MFWRDVDTDLFWSGVVSLTKRSSYMCTQGVEFWRKSLEPCQVGDLIYISQDIRADLETRFLDWVVVN